MPQARLPHVKERLSRHRRVLHPLFLRHKRQHRVHQAELASAIDETQQNVAYWEQSEYPPRADVLPRLAKALGVRVEDVIDIDTTSPARRTGPGGRAQKAFEQVARLPRRQQDKIIEIVEAFVAQHDRKAG